MMSGILLVVHILIALGVGAWGREYRFGFWGYFFATLLLGPVVGALLVIASMPFSNCQDK